MDGANNRQHFRLEFPPTERPKLVSGKFELVVLEVSEGGCSVEADGAAASAFGHVGIRVSGTIVFSNGDRHPMEGEVVRMTANSRISIKFIKGLTFAKMMDEHRRIRAKHHK